MLTFYCHILYDEQHQVNKIAIIVVGRHGFRSGLAADHVCLLMDFIKAITSGKFDCIN